MSKKHLEKMTVDAIKNKVEAARLIHPETSFAALTEEFLELTKSIQENDPYWHLEAIDIIVVAFRLLVENHSKQAKDL